jgi:phosphoglycolate phosphatase-like HAD superfamily hydrolase
LNREDLKTAVVFDKDSTLGDTRHRWHLAPGAGTEPDWDAYSAACLGDEPLPGPATLARLLHPYHQVHVCSGSNHSSRQVTLQWLTRCRIPYDALYQRSPGDFRKNWQLKAGYVNSLRALGVEVVLFVEDHPEVAAMIEAETGVPVLGVNPFYPEDLHKLHQVQGDGLGGGL